MEMQNILYVYFFQLLVHLPTIIAYLIGIGFSIMNISKHPKVSLLSGIACLILLFITFLSSATSLIPTLLYSSGNYDVKNVAYILSFVGVIFSIISAICFGLLITAIWKDRQASA